jgi:hypothetical protein
MMTRIQSIVASACLLMAASVQAADPQLVSMASLPEAPTVDGNLAEWGTTGWLKIPIKPAVEPHERAALGLDGEDHNATGRMTVQLKATVAQGRLFLAVRWPDNAADTEHKGWQWAGAKYAEGKLREDMLALRFHKQGDYDRSMLASKSYGVDVWLWSAARTNPAGLAEDWQHLISNKPIEDAAEYDVKGVGTVYIKKNRDAGSPIYRNLRAPKEKGVDRLPSFEITDKASGSVADVSAKGSWRAGEWRLEMSRRLDTGNQDDVVFEPGRRLVGQIAIFNRGSGEHKSVSEPLLFDFSTLR